MIETQRRQKTTRASPGDESRDVKKDNLERFFSSAARPRASALRSVSVVAGKKYPLRSSLPSTLLFQPPDSDLVASTALVQGLRQGPECGLVTMRS